MNRRGSVLIIGLFLFLGQFFLLLFAVQCVRLMRERERWQNIVDMTALSAARMKVQAWEGLPGKWAPVGALCGAADASGVHVEAAQWPDLRAAARDLEFDVRGYKARVSSVLTVLTGVHGVARSQIESSDDGGVVLGLVSEDLRISDGFSTEWVKSGWFRRGSPDPTLHLGPMEVGASARVVWDVNPNHSLIRDHGNGGYPLSWPEAVYGGRLDPHRYPLFRAVLGEQ